MIIRCAVFSLVILSTVPATASEPSSGNTIIGDRRSLAEENRLLEEEIKLAARPQIYLRIDLPERVLRIKGRGIELHQLPIEAWRMSEDGSLAGVFRLRARPPVVRPKAAPAGDDVPPVIDLQDMPQQYDLFFDPGLTIMVSPAPREAWWLWARSLLREGRMRLASAMGLSAEPEHAGGPRLRLTLSSEAARSLAWSVTDGMPVLIRRPIP